MRVGKKFKTSSPQVAMHLEFIDRYIPPNSKLVMGGDMPSSPASLLPQQPTELLELDDSHDTPDTPAKRQKLVDKMMARAP